MLPSRPIEVNSLLLHLVLTTYNHFLSMWTLTTTVVEDECRKCKSKDYVMKEFAM